MISRIYFQSLKNKSEALAELCFGNKRVIISLLLIQCALMGYVGGTRTSQMQVEGTKVLSNIKSKSEL